jgi:hypothetical protein
MNLFMKCMVLRDMIKNKQAIHGLKSEKLKKIRYGLRTLLRLELDTRITNINSKWSVINDNSKLSPSQRMEQRGPLIREKELLKEAHRKYPIKCIICGDRMRNLVYYPQYGWLCSLCEMDYK